MSGIFDEIITSLKDLSQRVAKLETWEPAVGGGGFEIGTRVTHSVSQTATTGVPLTLAFNTELYDTDNIHDTAVNNSRLTAQTAGKYLIVASMRWGALFAASLVYVQIMLNGTTLIAVHADEAVAGSLYERQAVTIWDMSVGDYVEMRAYQNSGIDQLVYKEFNKSPAFMMQKIG